MNRTIVTLSAVAVSAATLVAVASAAPKVRGLHAERRAHFFEKFDENKDGKVELSEFAAQGEQMFTSADTNQDGSVSEVEFDAAKKQHGSARLEEKFKRHDRNSDGKVTAEEAPNLPKRFRKHLDQNGDGVITLEEARAAMQRKHGRGQRWFKHVDADGNGQVTRAEAESAGKRRFTKLDKNADGVVSRDEVTRTHRSKTH